MGRQGRIHSVETFGTLDGPGIRYIVFLQGCALRCRYCHNPDTWKTEGGTLIDSEDVVQKIKAYRSFIAQGGVTISGGEPLRQPEFCLDLLKRCDEAGLHTALDTAGSVPLATSAPIIGKADLVLLDIKSIDNRQSFQLTGQGNALSLESLDYCESIHKEVWIRHVLVPGWTLETKRLEALADHLEGYRCITQVDLLPYHAMGRYKWEKLHLPYPLGNTPEPTRRQLYEAQRIFASRNLPVLMPSRSTNLAQKTG